MSFYGETEVGGPNGLTYAVLVTRLAHDELLEILTSERFSGWVAPTEDGWTVAVPESPVGHVASRRRRLPELAEAISDRTDAVVASVVVVKDELLRLWAGRGGAQLVDYVSDPSVGAEDAPLELDPFGNPVGISDGPVGAHGASALARAADRAQAADELQELLSERLGESENESERLQGGAAARLAELAGRRRLAAAARTRRTGGVSLHAAAGGTRGHRRDRRRAGGSGGAPEGLIRPVP